MKILNLTKVLKKLKECNYSIEHNDAIVVARSEYKHPSKRPELVYEVRNVELRFKIVENVKYNSAAIGYYLIDDAEIEIKSMKHLSRLFGDFFMGYGVMSKIRVQKTVNLFGDLYQ